MTKKKGTRIKIKPTRLVDTNLLAAALPLHHSCTIVRRFKRQYGHFGSGPKMIIDRVEIVTEACGTPLFSDEEKRSGVCNSCRKGWEVKDNRFATAAQRALATKGVTDE